MNGAAILNSEVWVAQVRLTFRVGSSISGERSKLKNLTWNSEILTFPFKWGVPLEAHASLWGVGGNSRKYRRNTHCTH